MIKIGGWSKQFDKASLLILVLILLALLVMTLHNSKAIVIFSIYLVIALGHAIRLIRSNYVYYDQGTFIIDGLFRPRRVISAVFFDGVSRSPFAIPLSNTIVLHFRTGDEIGINGGGDKIEDVEAFIRKLIASDRRYNGPKAIQ